MKIYKMIYSKKEVGFLGTYSKDSTYWALTPREDAEIVFDKNDCKYYDKWYAIEKNLENMSIKKILEVMYKNLSFDEVKQLVNEDEFLNNIFLCYLANPMSSSEFNKKLDEIKKNTNNAEEMATLGFIGNLLG